MENEGLIFTLSGIRGIAGKELNFDTAKRIAIAYGSWLNGEKQVVIGRDTRPSGKLIEKGILEGLIQQDFHIINLGICPTPVIIHTKNKLNIPGAIIITGSHNPPVWNGLKLLSKQNFLSEDDLKQISTKFSNVHLSSSTPLSKKKMRKKVTNLNPIPEYVKDLYRHLDYKEIKENNNLKVAIDTGAGAGKVVTPQLLREIGCSVNVINNDLLVKNAFPREIEPILKNLKDLVMEVWQGNYDIGFAHDSDADRLAIVGENGICYPEDIGLALIAEDYLKKYTGKLDEIIFVTNLASSLRFDVIAEKYNAQIIRTSVGEMYLKEKMKNLMENEIRTPIKRLIFGGEGSCGGIIFPYFNVTRDGIFAAAKIIEILVKTGRSVSDLVSDLPTYYSKREKINIKNINVRLLMDLVKKELMDEGEVVEQVNSDLRFGKGKEWFILIHPSNTEPVIRVISEAKRESLARVYCEATSELIKLMIKKL
ncbi:MAG: hypothetical protein ACFFCI_24020 [Promethearchaeota archaeon]